MYVDNLFPMTHLGPYSKTVRASTIANVCHHYKSDAF